MTDMAPIISLLRKEIGLNPDSIGENVVRQAVQRRMSATACTDMAKFIERLYASRDEVQELVEEVTVPETWFFREQSAFEALRRQAATISSARPLLVASMPCATGEEPYSIAMSLLETGLPAARFRVHALDISYRAILRAQLGEFNEYAFRTEDKTFRQRYFETTAAGYRINQAVRDQVSFYHGSVLVPPQPFATENYDVVFCRNLLIYLDDAARQKVAAGLKRMLSSEGILLAGHAETAILIQQGFTRKADGSLYIAATPPQDEEAHHSIRKKCRPRHHSVTDKHVPIKSMMPFPGANQQVFPTIEQPAQTFNDNCAVMRSLADSGRLNEARALCEKFLSEGQRNAELYCILSLVLHAQGDAIAARECLRKALYLDPQHEEANLQLAILLDGSGEAGRARSLRDKVAARKRGGGYG